MCMCDAHLMTSYVTLRDDLACSRHQGVWMDKTGRQGASDGHTRYDNIACDQLSSRVKFFISDIRLSYVSNCYTDLTFFPQSVVCGIAGRWNKAYLVSHTVTEVFRREYRFTSEGMRKTAQNAPSTERL